MNRNRIRSGVAAVLFAQLTFLAGSVFLGTASADPSTAAVAAGRPTVSPDALIVAHACWTHDGPVGVIPGHVVVTREGESEPVYAGARVAGQALRQIFDDEANGLTIHAFCR